MIKKLKGKKITLYIGLFINLLISILKFTFGFIGKSEALKADGFHSLSDLLTDFITIFSVKYSSKPPDKKHPYGHGRFETIGAQIVGIFIIITGFEIVKHAISRIIYFYKTSNYEIPGKITIIILFISILLKEILAKYTIKEGKRLNSIILEANAHHHRSDVYSSVAVFIGIGFSIIFGGKWVYMDPLSAIVVSFFVFKAGIDIFRRSAEELLDTSLPEEYIRKIINEVEKVKGAMRPHNIKARKVGDIYSIELHIEVEPHLSIREAHDIATEVEKKLKNIFGERALTNVHVEPAKTQVKKNL